MLKINKEKSIIKNAQEIQKERDVLINNLFTRKPIDCFLDELDEFGNAKTYQEKKEEIGDVLLMLCRVANSEGIDLEEALKESLNRFVFRNNYVFCKVKNLKNLTKNLLNKFWKKAKKLGKI